MMGGSGRDLAAWGEEGYGTWLHEGSRGRTLLLEGKKGMELGLHGDGRKGKDLAA